MEDYHKKEQLNWEEIYKVIEGWIRYGDDPFYDECAEIAYLIENEKDPKVLERLETIYKLMKLLERKLGW